MGFIGSNIWSQRGATDDPISFHVEISEPLCQQDGRAIPDVHDAASVRLIFHFGQETEDSDVRKMSKHGLQGVTVTFGMLYSKGIENIERCPSRDNS